MVLSPLSILRKLKSLLKPKVIITTFLILGLLIMGAKIYQIRNNYHVVFDEIIPEVQMLNNYEIDVTYNDEEKTLEGTEKITYVNNSKNNIKSIYFHIYPNVFKEKNIVPFHENEMDLAYREGFEPGYINILSVKSSKNDLSHLMIGKGNSILKVNLDEELLPEEHTNIYIDFMIKIPPANARFGYGKNTINLGNWYPITAVIDEGGWNIEPYYSIGDPFYSDVGNYRVTITTPQAYIVASSGDLVKKENIEGKYKWTLEAKKVRDFAIVMSTKYKLLENESDDVTIRSYYFNDDSAEVALKSARDAILIFGDTFGKYPYKHFSVAASDFFVGGMEYPKLVYIDEALYKGNDEMLEYVIVHETAHQWWYGIVGNNEIKEAWLDEALTEYSTLFYYEKKYGKDIKNKVYENIIHSGYERYKNSKGDDDEIILKHLKDFENNREYQALVYYKGAILIEKLRHELGDKDFFDSLKIYFDKYKYKNATTEDFIKVCEMVSDRELNKIFNSWLMGAEE